MARVGTTVNQDTRRRLLDAAGEIFAGRGFHGATVREICRDAETNIAAVNYHFGDKQRLYDEVLRDIHRYAAEKYPPASGGDERPPEERLAEFVRLSLLKVLDEDRPTWHVRLMARELSEPTGALDRLVEEEMRPRHEQVRAIVRDLLGPDADPRQVNLCVWSILGQCLLFRHSRAVIVRLYPEQRYTPEDVQRLAEHITRFSLGAIRQMARGEKEETA